VHRGARERRRLHVDLHPRRAFWAPRGGERTSARSPKRYGCWGIVPRSGSVRGVAVMRLAEYPRRRRPGRRAFADGRLHVERSGARSREAGPGRMIPEAAVSVPGKAILLGRARGVYGHPALVTAVDLRLICAAWTTGQRTGHRGRTLRLPDRRHAHPGMRSR
jgi:hypothetical protein